MAGLTDPTAGARLLPRARELEVLRLVVGGLSNGEIAARIRCTEGTVRQHVFALLQRAGVDGRRDLIARFRPHPSHDSMYRSPDIEPSTAP